MKRNILNSELGKGGEHPLTTLRVQQTRYSSHLVISRFREMRHAMQRYLMSALVPTVACREYRVQVINSASTLRSPKLRLERPGGHPQRTHLATSRTHFSPACSSPLLYTIMKDNKTDLATSVGFSCVSGLWGMSGSIRLSCAEAC